MTKKTVTTPQGDSDPAQLRSIFGENLRALTAGYPSIASLCRELMINRTQFNRYLSGESFPRPDVLHRICEFLGTDARILLEPVETLKSTSPDLLRHPIIAQYFESEPVAIPEDLLPSGLYRFVRRSFIDETLFVRGLVNIHRIDGRTFVRGSEPIDARRAQGLSTARRDREFRGIAVRQEEGIMMIIMRRNSLACSFGFLAPDTSFQTNLWVGYVTRAVREKISGIRATRMIYEHLGDDPATILTAARADALVRAEDLPLYQAHLLRPDEPFG